MKATNRFHDYEIIGVSSEDAEWPASSLKIYESSTEAFRSIGINTLTITIDLLSTVLEPLVLLYRVNFQTVRFYGNSADSWGAPPFSTQDLTIEEDPDDTLRKLAAKLTGFNYRYLRIEAPLQPPDDEAAFFEIGVLAVFSELEDFGVFAGGFEAPEMRQAQAEVVNRFETNRKDVIPLAPHPVLEIQLSGTMLNSVANRQKVNRVFGDPLRSLALMDRSGEGNSWQVYLAQRTGNMTMSEAVPGNAGARRYSGVWETIL